MRIILFILLLQAPAQLLSQNFQQNIFNLISANDYYWQDSLIDSQKEFYRNNTPKIEYKYSKTGVKIRFEYYSTGNLRLKAEVSQRYGLSEIDIYDEYGDRLSTEVDSGYHDIYIGEYKEYYNLKDQNLKVEGNFRTASATTYFYVVNQKEEYSEAKSIPIGTWNFYDEKGILTKSILYDWKLD